MLKIIQEFTSFLIKIGYSKTTVYMIPYCVGEFVEHQKIKDVNQIFSSQILAFYEYLQHRPHKRTLKGLSEVFIQHHIYSLRVFFRWLESTEQIIENPISHLKFIHAKPNTREPLTQAEIALLFDATNTPKERALLHLFYSCGLRRTEAESLNKNDIDFTQNLLYVREGKGAKRRVIPISEVVKKELQNYVLNAECKMQNVELKKSQQPAPIPPNAGTNNQSHPFMLNKNGERMSGDSCNRLLQHIVHSNELPFEISLHHLRHSIATHLFENGMSIEFVRDFLGHKHLEATQIYAKCNLKI